jgi:Zn2+/Cd2+-exporting ATPase
MVSALTLAAVVRYDQWLATTPRRSRREALEAADAALLKNRVQGVAELVALSRAVLRNIWQNITIALGLKVGFLATTLFGVTSLWMAILADTGATVLVTANALRLPRFRTSPWKE